MVECRMSRFAFFGYLFCIQSGIAQVAVSNVTVIDPRSGTVTAHSTVLITGDTIQKIGPAKSTIIPKKYERIDGTGRYLIPGLWDCHVHLTKAGVNSFPLFLANGVTSVRDMGSDPEEVMAWRRQIESGILLGPRIKLSGRILESKANFDRIKREGGVEPVDRVRIPIANPVDARLVIDQLKRLGVDHLKVRTVADPETFNAMAAAAKAAGLKLTGHALFDPRELVGKLQSVEHLISYPPLDKMNEDARRQLFHAMREEGTWMSTTLTNIESSVLVGYQQAKALLMNEHGRLDPRLRYIGGYLLSDWREQVEEKNDPEQSKMEGVLRNQLSSFYRDFRQMREEGVKFLAGTDVAVAFIYPGFSMHDELEIYARKLGFSPMETLRIATYNPAHFYEIETKQGSIAIGQAADLVLLDRNPLDDIRNTKSIRAVISRGKLLSRSRLNQLLKETAASVRKL